MLVDADRVERGASLRAPVVILGAGAAGISLARRLDQLGIESLLVESGDSERDDATQALYEGESVDYHPLTETRLRLLGGTTNHFGGQSRPWEAIDFDSPPWLSTTSWPITRAEALMHLDAAGEMLALPSASWDADDVLGEPGEGVLLPAVDATPVLYQASPLRMGPVYRPELEASSRVRLVTNANATQLRLDDLKNRVERVEVRTLAGNEFDVEGSVVVVATGGIDSARLLLDSDVDAPGGIGNAEDLVGRYFNDHPNLLFVPLLPNDRTRPPPQLRLEFVDSRIEGLRPSLFELLAPTEDAQRRLELPGFDAALFFDGGDFTAPSVVRDEAFEAGLADLAAMPGAGVSADLAPIWSLAFGWETIPNRDSRVTLLSERNAVGERKVRVEWKLGDDDENNARRALALLGSYLGAAGVGTLLAEPPQARWIDQVEGQHHHMGTLRMADSPRDGVVDRDLKVHDVSNLFVASSAVFPNSGHVNPTLNLVALTLRLAEHLARQEPS